MSNISGELEFPWANAPVPGQTIEIAPGLLWARHPLPFRLNHVHSWLLDEGEGWTCIDTGCDTPDVRNAWETLFAGPMQGRKIDRVVATHGHVDHIGLSGWLHERFDAEFWGSFGEWIWARISHIKGIPGAADAQYTHLMSNGFSEQEAREFLESRDRFLDLATPLPGSLHEIRDGDTVSMGGRDWQAIQTSGHSFEHMCFFNREENILIAGDHLLSKISPVVAVYEMVPHGDPLRDFLVSFSKFDHVPDDVLVLPSHGLPYRGIRRRITELRDHHRERLDMTLELLKEPRTGYSLIRAMFPKVQGVDNLGFAFGEALAHVNYLIREGLVANVSEQPGKMIYKAVA
ncbi:MBL fold metallo-hydrolase [Tianweitania sediminis]|uniref:MBL fold metallo-hydrolase n=1 Tax=Tianweitania sediminis TaxID=1502156 RepID=A0A8J7UJS5_9HYPH|nr:MBL fold metallo-hydrolase [Tianweitania sediminis]MBP0440343.1 MBL fold metallo-hydrolase [Tianweitania sediminis]